MTVFWGMLALVLMLPAMLMPWMSKTDGSPLLMRGALFLALIGASFTTMIHLMGHWDGGVSISLWITISFSLLLFLCFSLLVKEFEKLSLLLVPYLFVLGFFAVIWGGQSAAANPIDRMDNWLVLHILASILTYALCTLAAISAVSVQLRERALKLKKIESPFLVKLPSVYDSDRFQVSLLTMAEVVLGLGILTGIAKQYSVSGYYLDLDHKSLLALLAFVVIAVLLLLHKFIGIRGQNAVRFVLAVYLLLTLAYPGVKFVTDILLV
ncbi:cytochrome c biogenesis protein CcsA [Kiloniella sp. EL199]|uniref:cytochrome c biogenesis protein CcsA n=1 Tax=Kiloniella sp. EL199 TaxID=2107581 RepID=UPI000EA04BBE|nr:cytochrome c biogenesis protein CcsA [Kiloniella sp. EL199]